MVPINSNKRIQIDKPVQAGPLENVYTADTSHFPMITIPLIVILTLAVITLAVFAGAVHTATLGYQDREGFHCAVKITTTPSQYEAKPLSKSATWNCDCGAGI